MTAHRLLAFFACLLTGGLVGTVSCATERPAPTAPIAAVPAASSGEGAAAAPDDAVVEPHFLQAEAGGPGVANPVVSFWAKKGEDRRVRMYYNAAPGAADSTTFLEFRVGKASLAAYPDGRRFAANDSVRITISLVDAERLIVDCQPSGLRFAADRPASLKMSFAHTDAGAASADPSVERSLRIWRREADEGPWFMQRTAVEVELHEVRSDVIGFSGYVIAY
jgi:hypothetical protein